MAILMERNVRAQLWTMYSVKNEIFFNKTNVRRSCKLQFLYVVMEKIHKR